MYLFINALGVNSTCVGFDSFFLMNFMHLT